MIYMIIDIGVRVCAATLFTIFWGSGPATAGMHYILRNYARGRKRFYSKRFLGTQIKDNFKQSLAVFVIDILFMFIFFYGIYFYSSADEYIKVLQNLSCTACLSSTPLCTCLYTR